MVLKIIFARMLFFVANLARPTRFRLGVLPPWIIQRRERRVAQRK